MITSMSTNESERKEVDGQNKVKYFGLFTRDGKMGGGQYWMHNKSINWIFCEITLLIFFNTLLFKKKEVKILISYFI